MARCQVDKVEGTCAVEPTPTTTCTRPVALVKRSMPWAEELGAVDLALTIPISKSAVVMEEWSRTTSTARAIKPKLQDRDLAY